MRCLLSSFLSCCGAGVCVAGGGVGGDGGTGGRDDWLWSSHKCSWLVYSWKTKQKLLILC